MMKKMCWVVLATLLVGGPASAQSQFQTTFEAGIGYGRPGIGQFDMVTLLLQSDDYLFESGIGFDINGSEFNGDTVFSWIIRGGIRPILLGNTIVHVGGEFSLHTNSTVDPTEAPGDQVETLIGLGVLFGVSQPLTDHLNFEVHVLPIAFAFGGNDTITKIATAKLGAHVLF
ncbi:MAG: hypothetical protein ACE5G2_09580 [Candidatus Krumholzibacteriia bacterium]